MKQHIDYKIVIGHDAFNLEFEVKCKILDGWEPVGGVVVSQVPVNDLSGRAFKYEFLQTMIKRPQ